jgi:16S rRNA processing protein RimM
MTSTRADPKNQSFPGSPSTGEPVFLAVGKLHRAHGIQGEIIMEVLTDFPERLNAGDTLFVGKEHQPVRLRSRRWHNRNLLVAFEGYANPEVVGIFVNQLVQVRADDRPPLPEGEYYHHQLLGLQVVDENGRPLGRLKQILETGANDVYIVQPEQGKEILLPAIDSVLRSIDLAQGQIIVHLLPGLLPDG